MPAKSKAKSKPTQTTSVDLVLPVPHRLNNTVDAMLQSTIQERWQTILLVPSGEKDESKGRVVLAHVPSEKDPNAQVIEWGKGLGHLSRFIQTIVNGLSSGFGLSGDGSCSYVGKTKDTVLKALPKLLTYDLVLVPNGRSGAKKYRVSMKNAIEWVAERGSNIDANVKEYGIAQGKERTRKEDTIPAVSFLL